MMTLEQLFHSRVSAFLRRTGMRPTTFGLRALGDPNLMRQIDDGRSPSLRTADRLLAFIAANELDSGGPWAPPGQPRRQSPETRAWNSRRKRSRTMTERPESSSAPIRFLRISEVAARTGLSRTTVYEWSADGRLPRPVRLSPRAVRWIEADVEEWIRERIAESRDGAEGAAHRSQEEGDTNEDVV